MGYNNNDKHREEINISLKEIAKINATLGTDSTDEERELIRSRIEAEENKIKLIDPQYWKEVFEID